MPFTSYTFGTGASIVRSFHSYVWPPPDTDTSDTDIYINSSRGWVNLRGPQGATGAPGPQGIPGPTGPSGAGTFLAGTANPTAGDGVDGAIYLNVTNGRMYGPKAAGAWPANPIGILVRDATTYDQLATGT